MPRWNSHRRVEAAATSPGVDDFHEYLARNLSDGYRLAAMVLDDPIEAGAVLRGAIMSAWLSTSDPSPEAVDESFRRRFDADLQAAVQSKRSVEGLDVVVLGPLEAAMAGLGPRLEIGLASGFGPWEGAGPFAGHGATAGQVAESQRALQGRLVASDAATPPAGDTDAQIRSLYEARDPGEPAPLPLRMRLQQDLREAEVASVERTRLARVSGWRFAFNAFLVLIVLSLLIALASVLGVRSSPIVAGDPTSDPASPLTISGVSLVQGSIDGVDVHVGATQGTMIVAFAPSPLWHSSDRQCQADIFGVIDWRGQTTWIGQRAGHTDFIAGDPSSASAYVAGLGAYCGIGRFATADGGVTWSAGALPGGAAENPAWLSFDPARAHELLAYYPGTLYTSTNSGASWTSAPSPVAPLAFDSTGRLVGWSAGILYQSMDDGASWRATGPGPGEAPAVAGANSGGVLIGAKDGLWWYPSGSKARLGRAGSVFSIATLGDGAVVLGADSTGHPWLGTVDAATPGISVAALPPEIAALQVSGGSVAVNDSGAVVAFSGGSSAIALVSFGR
jgi:hypothetical protein